MGWILQHILTLSFPFPFSNQIFIDIANYTYNYTKQCYSRHLAAVHILGEIISLLEKKNHCWFCYKSFLLTRRHWAEEDFGSEEVFSLPCISQSSVVLSSQRFRWWARLYLFDILLSSIPQPTDHNQHPTSSFISAWQDRVIDEKCNPYSFKILNSLIYYLDF